MGESHRAVADDRADGHAGADQAERDH